LSGGVGLPVRSAVRAAAVPIGAADIDRGTRFAVGDIALAVLEEGLVARIRPEDLIALRACLNRRR
jgi:hypothetical protein